MQFEDADFLFKVVVAGETAVGKTNLLSRYIKNEFSNDKQPTIGVEFATKVMEMDDLRIRAQIWDTAGLERFRGITTTYYRGASAAMVVYDITNNNSFDKCLYWVTEIRKFAEQNVVIALIGNKMDLDEERQVPYEDARAFSKGNDLLFIETSALDTTNVDAAFKLLLTETYHRNQDNPKRRLSAPCINFEDFRSTPEPVARRFCNCFT